MPLFARSIRSKTHKHGDQSDSIYRHKDRNEGYKEFVDHAFRSSSAQFSAQMNTDQTEIQQNSVCLC
jgi:hypothetical protein